MMMMMMTTMTMTIVSVEQRPGWGEHVSRRNRKHSESMGILAAKSRAEKSTNHETDQL